jgi:pSer/pThr/pTyr-binding forkhead associated (FHA) protein
MPMSKIRILNGPLRGREKSLADKPLTIGRDAEAGIQILDRSASRLNCEIFPVGGMWFVRDLDSKNGTYINDERLKDEELLRVGDVIKIGATELVYEGGSAISDDDSSNRVAYNDDPDMLSNTLEFRLDELSDISEPADQGPGKDNVKSLRILYQIGRIVSEQADLPDREARVLDCLIASMPAECALIFRRDAASGKLMPSVVRTSAPNVQPVISRSIIKKTFTENKALHSANAQDDDRFSRNQSIVIKGIRSVICVPLSVVGKVIGVVYLSRGAAMPGSSGMGHQPAFDQMDLELVSACAIQVGLAQAAAEERRRHKHALNLLITTMVRSLEGVSGMLGTGERCARTCVALASSIHLDQSSRERLRQAGMLHHFGRLVTPAGKGTSKNLMLLEQIEELESVVSLVRQARERIDGSGPLATSGDDLDTEARVLAVAVAFEDQLLQAPGSEDKQLIEILIADKGLDKNLTQLLLGCHLDGSLYAKDS